MGDRDVRIAGIPTDPRNCTTGLLFSGVSSGGKSSLMQMLMGDVIHRRDPMLALDLSGGETELIEWLAGMVPGYEVDVIDPAVVGSSKVDLTKLVNSESGRWYFASKIFPDIKGDPQPFFNLTAREIFFCALCVVCHFCPDGWELADVIRIVSNRPLFSFLVGKVPGLDDPFKTLGDHKSANDVHATVRMRLAPLRTAAALMLKATKKVDLLHPKGAIVLRGRDRDVMVWSVLFAFYLDVVSDYRLDEPRSDLLWLFMDEVRQLQPMQCLSALTRRGRKTSTIPVASIQSVDGMNDLYGKDKASEILHLFARLVALRQAGGETARFVAERMGEVESLIDVAPPRGNTNTDRQRTLNNRFNVTVDELRRIPLPDAKADKIVAYYDGPDGTYPIETPWLADVSPPKGYKPKVRVRRPAADEVMPKLNVADCGRLNFPTDLPLELLK